MAISRKESLEVEKESLLRRLREIETELGNSVTSGRPVDTSPPEARIRKPKKPLREIVIGMLSDTGCMLNNTIIRQLYETRFQKNLAGSRLGSLSHDEQVRKNLRNTTVFGLVHPIQLVDERILPVKNIWARSDWPVESRVMTPCTDMLLHLRFLDWYLRSRNSNSEHYLKSPAFVRFTEGMIDYVGLKHIIKPPFDTAQARKAVLNMAADLRSEEEEKYSGLIFKAVLAYKKSKNER